MSLGDNNINNQDKKYYDTVFSPLCFYSANDDAALNFRFVLSGILEIRMVPKNKNGVGFDDKNAIAIFITPNKAMMLSQALVLLKNAMYKGEQTNFGICNNKKTSNIEFGCTKEENGMSIYTTIYKYNDDGKIYDRYTFKFRNDEYIIQNFSPNNLSYDSIPVPDLPLTLIQNLLNEYVKGMTGGQAYGLHYSVGQYKYNIASIKKMLLGDYKPTENKFLGSGNSIFNNNGGNQNNSNSFNNDDFDDFDFE